MLLLFFIGLVLVATAAWLLTRAVAMPSLRVSSQLRQIDTYGFSAAEDPVNRQRPPLRTRLNPLAERIGRSVGGEGILSAVSPSILRAAGVYSISPDAFQGYRVMLSVVLPGLLLMDALLGRSVSAMTLLLVPASAGICWMLPASIVKSRGQRRMDAVDRALPDLIDVLIATVEAGLGLAGSLRMVADRFDGPLGQELRLMRDEQNMGLSAEQALSNLVERCDTPSIRAFVRAASQGESLGVSIGTMLRNLASEVRRRRRQTAREKIMKAPVKMLFPLVLLMLPALFIVLLYPAASSILHALGGH